MGCFHSKATPPHTAFTRDLSLSLKKRIIDLTPLEDLINSRPSSNDQFLSLLYTLKRKSKSQHHQHPHPTDPIHTTADPVDPPETINAWELMADLLDDEEHNDHRHQQAKDRIFTTQTSPAEEPNSPPPSNPSNSHQDHVFEINTASDLANSVGDSRQDLSEIEQRSKDCAFATEEPFVETGFRSKAKKMGLKLKVPSFDFYGGGELGRWNGEDGQVNCDGSYETPRFGSYGRSAADHEAVFEFDPELVAELEEAMERLTEEEEELLRRIVEECLEEVEG